jgi:hypothetical protein
MGKMRSFHDIKKGPGWQIQRLQEKFMFNRHILVRYLPSVIRFIIDPLCHLNVMDLRALFLNCPLPWGTNYPTQFVVGWH